MTSLTSFRFEFLGALNSLASCDDRLRAGLSHFLQLKSWTFQDKQSLLQKLAKFIRNQEFAPLVVNFFKPLLLEIIERAAKYVLEESKNNPSCNEEFCYILSQLVSISHLKDFIYSFIKSSSLLSSLTNENDETSCSVERILCLVKTGYNLLCSDFQTFCKMLDWSPVFNLLQHSHPEVRWYSLHIVAMVTDMSDQTKLTLIDKQFAPEERNNFLIDNRLSKNTCISNSTQGCLSENGNIFSIPDVDAMDVDRDSHCGWFFSKEDLTGKYTTICGVVLSRLPRTLDLADNSLVMVPSTVSNLHSLALAVASGSGVMLEGPIGSGKTVLVEYLARATGRSSPPDFMKIQLGDQTDSKSLLGTYICTDIPGEFVWQPGTLLQAVRSGHWILLEDIDLAPMDVISVLIPLLESCTLSVPAHGNVVKAAPGFQLFATQRSYSGLGGFTHQVIASSAILDKLWTRVHVEPLTKEELTDVLYQKYPDLESVASKLVDIFCLLSADPKLVSVQDTAKSSLPHDKRLSSTRDFMKWCSRIAVTSCGTPSLFDGKDLFLEAQDCFSAPLPKTEDRLLLDMALGAKLGLTQEKIEFFFRNYKPKVHLSPLSLTVGRVSLKRKVHDNLSLHSGRKSLPKFAHTRHALVLLERVASCVRNNEPVLLVGETGTGKTSTVQHLAAQCGCALKVVNMSQQSDSSDLLGGYKPVEMKQLVAPVRETFEVLFCDTFSRKQNVKFLSHVQQCFAKGQWEVLFKLMIHCQKNALDRLRKDAHMLHLVEEWQELTQTIQQLRKQQKNAESALAFRFIEGTLVQAIRQGDWVLLDEINLATPETLECLSGLLESSSGSVVLMERGDVKPAVRHDDFRLFACMNPATDVGKKDLPPGIRNRFTEVFVSELEDNADLKTLVVDYLQGLSPNAAVVDGIVRFYVTARHEAGDKLTDGTGHKPHYSLRTLCRALRYASTNPHGNALRSIYEGFCLSFLTQLGRSSHPAVQSLIKLQILGHVNAASLLKQPLPKPRDAGQFTNFEGFWVAMGDMESEESPEYVLTASVKANLKDLSRVVSARKLPVLIQGETSVGKTSLIQWLAKSSGNHCVRINNHEHTDIQEYLGCYTSDENGKLVFKEGVLVDAMRKGHWIILDELNLAPSDVLEALNRLLDDNRELFIPETQETVMAHPMFMLFATQNPPGHYGGRKVLSRAFRNRFVELHFDELPSQELEVILHQRCSLPLSYAKKLVAVMLDLQAYRSSTNVFAGKQGFITLRDLFRWAERYSKTPDIQGRSFHDWDQHLAEDGYMLLAGRCRNPGECKVIQEVIERHMKRKLDLELLFGDPALQSLSPAVTKLLTEVTTTRPDSFHHIVWTRSMRRLAVLAGRALQFGEPVLLVGETGCGKTTICQLFAALWNQKLHAVNCHMHSESADFLGGLRPVRNREQEDQNDQVTKLFEWCDGPLVQAMKEGAMFLVDEISLADDSVLERLNSVLEPERTLLLAEKGGSGGSARDEVDVLVAHKHFKIVGTMNPGGDFGKKELSPALRNRFTEVWCPPTESRADLIQIIEHNLKPGVVLQLAEEGDSGVGNAMMDFIEWFHSTDFGKRCVVSIRDLLSWVHFINTCSFSSIHSIADDSNDERLLMSPALAYVHGACLVFLDALGSGVTSFASSSSALSSPITAVKEAYQACFDFLNKQVVGELEADAVNLLNSANSRMDLFGIEPFFIERGPLPSPENLETTYTLNSPTTSLNAKRILRALQLSRPILLEGSPGVGKTSLVGAVAKASGNELIRINLSEQTDVTDLFGADLPVEGGKAGQFVWRDGPLLKALKAGHWVVLDELNLASQSVLEGLNACLDHRAEVYIPELGMTFKVQRDKTRLFACQNPLNQGGGRKGLPKSFMNRFTQVYVEPLSKADLLFITQVLYPQIDSQLLNNMVTFNMKIHQETVVEGRWGRKGSPWELNLRDVFRWCDLLINNQVINLFKTVFLETSEKIVDIKATRRPMFYVTPTHIQVGHSWLSRCSSVNHSSTTSRPLQLLHHCLPSMESLMKCLEMNWMAILIGPRSSGKTSLVHLIAQLTGNRLEVMAMNSAMDTTELLGGFEQADLNRHWAEVVRQCQALVLHVVREFVLRAQQQSNQGLPYIEDACLLYRLWVSCSRHHQTANDGECYKLETLTSEKLTGLEQMIQTVLDMCGRADITAVNADTVMEMLHSLRLKLKANGDSAHCGGQFEWVDGQLVEALKCGYWLLIDNVNFCSPSVLDRLNALLEPGGVLTIDERGVIDGKIPSIKPHPNFRLILAMDPRYGEISRAMRNRGVEIYMLGEEDEEFDDYDVRMMLHGLGLVNSTACNHLLAFHKKIMESLQGSILDMIHAASLTTQLLQRGSDSLPAVVTALKQVYMRSQMSEHNKQVAESLINKHISGTENMEEETCTPPITDCFPSAQAYQFNSVVSTIQLQCLPVMQTLHRDVSSVQFAVRLFLERSSLYDWKLRLDHLKSVMDSYLEQSSSSCIQDVAASLKSFTHSFRTIFSSHLMEGLRMDHQSLRSSRFEIQTLCHQPFDLRLNTDLFQYLSQDPENDLQLHKSTSLVNRLLLLEMRARQSYKEEKSLCVAASSKRSQTWHLIQLSHAFHSGQLQSESLPHPAVVHLWPFFKHLASFVEHCVCQVGPLSDEEFWKVVDGLVWRDRLWRMCELQSGQNMSASVLSLHWCWVVENTLSTVPAALGIVDHNQLPGDLVTVVNHLSSILGADSRLAKVYAKILVTYGHPPPFQSEKSHQSWERARHLCQLTGLYNDKKERTSAKRLLTCNAEEIRRKLTEVMKVMLTNRLASQEEPCVQYDATLNSLEETVSRNVVSQEEMMLSSEDCLESRFPSGADTTVESRLNPDLLTLFDNLCSWQEQSVLGSLMLCLANQTSCWSAVENVISVREMLKALTNFQTNRTRRDPEALAYYQHLHAEMSKVENVDPKLSSTIQHLESELLFNHFMLKSKALGRHDSRQERFRKDVEPVTPGVFHLLGGGHNLLETVSHASKKPSQENLYGPMASIGIGEYHEKIEQLQVVSKHFWVNGDYIDNYHDLERTSDMHLFSSKLCQAILSMKKLLSASDQEWVTSVVSKFMGAVNNDEHLHDLSSTIDAMRTAIVSVSEGYKRATGDGKQSVLICSLLTECLEGMASLKGKQSLGKDPGEKIESAVHRGTVWVKLGLVLSLILSPVGPVDPVERNRIELQYVNEEIETIEKELEVRFYAEELWTGLKTDRNELEALLTRESWDRAQLTSNPNRVQWLLTKLKELKTQAGELSTNSAFRPARSQFEAILGEVKHYMSTVGSTDSIVPLVTSLSQLVSQLSTALRDGSLASIHGNSVQTALHREKAWRTSAERFVQRLRKEYALYCDLLVPFVAALSQVIYGLSLVSSNLAALYQQFNFWAQFPVEELYEVQVCELLSAPEKTVQSLCGFPVPGSSSCLEVAVSLLSPSTQAFIQGLAQCMPNDKKAQEAVAVLMFRILRASLLHVRQHYGQLGYMSGPIHHTLNGVLATILDKWKLAKEQEKKREEEEGSLFKFGNKSHGSSLSEEDEHKRAVSEAFPSFDSEFKDLMPPRELDDDMEKTVDSEKTQEGPASDAELFMGNLPDFSEIRTIHEEMFGRVSSSQGLFLGEEERCASGRLESEYLESFQWGYQTAAMVCDVVPWQSVGDGISRSHLLQSCIMKGHFPFAADGKKVGVDPYSPVNIYHDSSIEEVMKVKPVLLKFMGRVHELLIEWPQHPALLQLLVVMERILSFSVTSPLMKILTGLEVLLRKAQDWESNAAKHVSLKEHLDSTTHLIIQWRKMELKCWSSLLDVATVKASDKASQWWFHLYNLLDRFRVGSQVQEHDAEDFPLVNELIEPLQRFIESSTMGEFASRVQMLRAFYREMCHEEGDASSLEVKASDMLWNIYSYYNQFIPCVENSLQETRKPVEKELKDFVKIAKWNDSNFWAMKQAADRSHHTLHKFVRKYEYSLNEPVQRILMDEKKTLSSTDEGKYQTGQRKAVQTDWFISPLHLKVYCESGLEVTLEGETEKLYVPPNQARLPKLFTKMRQLSRKLLSQRQYLLLVTSLDDFTGDVIVGSKELQALDVSSQPKEKQAVMRKHIQQRKRKGLADLFKMLASLGLSYRKGLSLERQSTGKEAMLLAAVDEDSLTRSLVILSDRPPDLIPEVGHLLEGCRHHYYRSLARSAAFAAAMVTPSKELSVGDVDRCKGCSQHLQHVCYEQRTVIATFSRNISRASVCLRQLTEAMTSPTEDVNSSRTSLPPQTDLGKHTVHVMSLLTHTAQTLQKVSLMIKCCPSDVVLQEASPLPLTLLSPLAAASASDPPVAEVAQKLQSCLHEVQKLAGEVRPYSATLDCVPHGKSRDESKTPLASWRQFSRLSDVVDKLKSIAEIISGFLPQFASKCCPSDEGLGGPLSCLKSKIIEQCSGFEIWRTGVLSEHATQEVWSQEGVNEQVLATVNSFIKDVDSVNTSLLLAVQRLTKLAENESGDTDQENQDSNEDKVDSDVDDETCELQSGHVATLLHRNLLDEIASLNLGDVTESISRLMTQLKLMADCSGESSAVDTQPTPQVPRLYAHLCAQLLGNTIPLLHQYLNISQSLLVDLLSSHRATSKLLSVLLNIFTDLASRGFCLPPEIEEGEGEGATEFEDVEGGGIGEGEGMKDVSDQIENEDQLEDTKQQGQDEEKKDENQQQIPDEENGIEMSENFDGALHDVDADDEQNNEESEEEKEEEPDVDRQMGDVDGRDTEKLDEKMWGDEDEEEEEKEEQEVKEEKGSGAEAEAQSQLVAKEDNKGATDESKTKTDQEPGAEEEQSDEKPGDVQGDDEGNMSEEEASGEAGPQGLPDTEEPENLDLPDDLQLDEEGNEQSEDQPEEMETEEGEGEDMDVNETEEESATPGDDQADGNNEEELQNEEEEPAGTEESKEGAEGDEKEDGQESAKEEDNMNESDDEDWRTGQDTQSQDSVQAVEDSGKSDGTGEQADKTDKTAGQAEPSEGSEERGVGRAEAPDNEGHSGESCQSTVQAKADSRQQSRQRKQMNRARSDRSLGSMDETTHKRLKTVDKTEQESGNEANETRSQDLFQHVHEQDQSPHDAQTLDSATADQAQEQEKGTLPEMLSDKEDEEEDSETSAALLEENEELPAPEKGQQSRLLPPPLKPKMAAESEDKDNEDGTSTREEDMESTETSERNTERLQSTFHSSQMALAFERMGISSLDAEKLRADLEHQLADWANLERGTAEEQRVAQEAWRKYDLLTSSLSQELCEQLRLVLEPSLATKLKGDYRSGKRLNMRKVIPYIASQFRKDKIWLRRTKPSKRQYQIMLAVDDSSSMSDNHSKQLAFESLAVISNALTRLEAGDFAVSSFGESVRLLHPFHEPFTDQSGARILHQFTFDQKKTKIAQLLDTCTSLMLSAQSRMQVTPRMRRDTSQLLLIVSDGRGIFLEGMERVQRAVRVAREANIFMVFVILDNPANKDSVLDIRVPIFRPGKAPEIKSYMEQFPFPFYIILRDINALPLTLSDALRQWFELVSSMD